MFDLPAVGTFEVTHEVTSPLTYPPTSYTRDIFQLRFVRGKRFFAGRFCMQNPKIKSATHRQATTLYHGFLQTSKSPNRHL